MVISWRVWWYLTGSALLVNVVGCGWLWLIYG